MTDINTPLKQCIAKHYPNDKKDILHLEVMLAYTETTIDPDKWKEHHSRLHLEYPKAFKIICG